MSNGRTNYPTDYRRKDLSDVGKRIRELGKVSHSETLQGLVGISLQIAQNAYLDGKSEAKSDLTTAITSLSTSLKNLDYTQYGTEYLDDEGKTVDIYDNQADIVKDHLDELVLLRDDPRFKDNKDIINLALEQSGAQYAYQEVMKDKRQETLDTLENLFTEYQTLIKNTPILSEDGSLQDSKDIMKAIQNGYINLEKTYGAKIPVDMSTKVLDLQKTQELELRKSELDVNESIEGLQISLSDTGSPYLQQMFQKMGMEQVPPEYLTPAGEEEALAGQVSYMPQVDPKTGEYLLPDVTQYKDALKAFDKYQLVDVKRESDKLILREVASGLPDFEVVRDWMEAGTAEQSMYGLYIGHEMFADPNEPNPYLSELDPSKVANLPMDQLREKKASGMYAQQFKDMQKNFIALQNNFQKQARSLIENVPEELASNVRFMSTNLNNVITSFNANPAVKKEALAKVPTFAEGTMENNLSNSKTVHVQALSKILSYADEDEYFSGNYASSEEPLLGEFKEASGIVKWAIMRKLVEKYLDANGQRKNEDHAIETWDAGDNQGRARMSVFYAVLESFQALIAADPTGTDYSKKAFGKK